MAASIRKVQELVHETSKAIVYWCYEFMEFVVKFYKEGVYQEEADYFTDSRSDAIGTAKWQIGATV